MFWEWLEDRLRQAEWTQKVQAYSVQSTLHKLIVTIATVGISAVVLLVAVALM